MTVVRLLNAQPDMHASERTLLGEIAFRAALSEKLVMQNATDQSRTSINIYYIVSLSALFVNMFDKFFCEKVFF